MDVMVEMCKITEKCYHLENMSLNPSDPTAIHDSRPSEQNAV